MRNKNLGFRYIIIVFAVIVLAAILFVSISFLNGKDQTASISPPEKNIAKTSATYSDKALKSEGITIDGDIKVQPSGENKDSFKIGQDVKVTLKLENNSDQKSRFLTINTNLEPNTFYNMRNFDGMTGVDKKNDEITIKNVLLSPGQVQELSFEATINGVDGESIDLIPTLVDITGSTVVSGETVTYMVHKN